MKDWIDKEVEKLIRKGKKMSKIEFLRLIFIVAYSRGKEEYKEDVVKFIDKLPFIVCIKDAEGRDEVSKSWREQFVIRREELKKELEKIK